MKNFFILIFAVALCMTSNLSFAAKATEGTPTRAIQDLDDRLADYKTGANLSDADKEFNRQLKKDIIHGTFDIKELGRMALDKHWFPRTYNERKEFIDVLTDLLENRAILSKEQGQKKAKTENVYTIRYIGEKFLNDKRTRAVVRTTVFVKSEDITVKLDYKLRKKGDEWMIYDVIMDGASLVDNYKYQFDRIITKNGYSELVVRMKKKLNEIKEEGDEGKV